MRILYKLICNHGNTIGTSGSNMKHASISHFQFYCMIVRNMICNYKVRKCNHGMIGN